MDVTRRPGRHDSVVSENKLTCLEKRQREVVDVRSGLWPDLHGKQKKDRWKRQAIPIAAKVAAVVIRMKVLAPWSLRTMQPALRHQILELVERYHDAKFADRAICVPANRLCPSPAAFSTPMNEHLVDSSLDFWLTTGRFADHSSATLPAGCGVRASPCWSIPARRPTCSRSRASRRRTLGDRRLQPGDEVITVAAGFPDHGQPDHSERLRPGLRRRGTADV